MAISDIFDSVINSLASIETDANSLLASVNKKNIKYRFYDGTYFFELRIQATKIELFTDSTSTFTINNFLAHKYRITVQAETVNIYCDGQLALTSTLSTPTASKMIEMAVDSENVVDITSLKYTTTGAYAPSNTEDILLEEVISFADASANRIKTYKEGLFVATDPIDSDLSSSVYRYNGQKSEERTLLAITEANINAVIVDPHRQTNIFGTSGKYVATDAGLQYIIGSKPVWNQVTSFAATPNGNGWTLDETCTNNAESVNNNTLTVDTSADTGKWEYVQSSIGNLWVDKADNKTGWTVEVKVKVLDDGNGNSIDEKSMALTDACGNEVSTEDFLAPGIIINDGSRQETIQFFAKGIRLKNAKLFGECLLSEKFYTIRIIGKDTAIAVYAKSDSDDFYKQIIFSTTALTTPAGTVSPQEKPHVIVDKNGILHAVWQETSENNIIVKYSKLEREQIATGSGLVGSKKFNPQGLITVREAMGLSPATVDSATLAKKNVLIDASASFITNNVYIGMILMTYGTKPRTLKITKIISDVAIELDTQEDLTNVGPCSYSIVSGDASWSVPVQVSNNVFDSNNPRVLVHSSGLIYVVYDANDYGNSEVWLRPGRFSTQGIEWGLSYRVTNSTHSSQMPDISELSDGRIAIVYEDLFESRSNIVLKTLNPNLEAEQIYPSVDLTSSNRAFNPRISSNADKQTVVIYEDINSSDVRLIKSICITETGAVPNDVLVALDVQTEETLSTYESANPTICYDSNIFHVAWQEEIVSGKPDIYRARLLDHAHSGWQKFRVTSNRESCLYPTITTELNSMPVIFYVSDRTRNGYFDLYASRIGLTKLPDGLIYNQYGRNIIGTPSTNSVGDYVYLLTAVDDEGTVYTATFTLHIVALEIDRQADTGALPSPFTGPSEIWMVSGVYETHTIEDDGTQTINAILMEQDSDNTSFGTGLDIKLETYLTQNSRPSAVQGLDGTFGVVFEGFKNSEVQTVWGTTCDLNSNFDDSVVAYFPLNETSGTTVHNRLITFDENGNRHSTINGTTFDSIATYTTNPVVSDSTLFGTIQDKAFDLSVINGSNLYGGFGVSTSLIEVQGAIDLYLKPTWASNVVDTDFKYVLFGNANPAEISPTNHSLVCGVKNASPNPVIFLRVVDENGVVHETTSDATNLWQANESVHLRASWDNGHIGNNTFNEIAFSQTNTDYGWAVGPEGAIWQTLDAGTTWTRINLGTPVTYDLLCVACHNNGVTDNVFIGGEMGTVIYNQDASGTGEWKIVNLRDVTTVGADTTLAERLETTDIQGIHAYTNTTLRCIAVGTNGVLVRTTTGGISWNQPTFTAPAGYAKADLEFRSVARLANGGPAGKFLVVGKNNVVYISTANNSSSTYVAEDLGVSSDWNYVSKYGLKTYVVGNSGSIVRTTNNGSSWTDLSTRGENVLIPNLHAVSTSLDGVTVWIPWSEQTIAISTDSGATFSYFATELNEPFKSVCIADTNRFVSGAGGIILKTSADDGTGFTYINVNCSNLNLTVNGKQLPQTKNNDGPFNWDPTTLSKIYFADYLETSREQHVGARTSVETAAAAIMDEIVIYSVPNPSFSVYNRHELSLKAVNCSNIIPEESSKRLTWGAIESDNRSTTQWQDFRFFVSGAKEPIRQFMWDSRTGLCDNVVLDINPDSRGYLWGTTNNGIFQFDLRQAAESTNAYLLNKPQPKFTTKLLVNYTGLSNNINYETVNCITFDINDNVWAGTPYGLLYCDRLANLSAMKSIFDGTSTTNTVTFKTFTTANGLPSNNILSINASKMAIYVGTDAGLAVIKNPVIQETTTTTKTEYVPEIYLYTTSNGLPSNRIQSINIDKLGFLWIGTDKGVTLFRDKNSITYNTSNGLIARDVQSIGIDIDNTKYIGTGFGLTTINGTNINSYAPSSGVGYGALRDFAEDGTGSVWIASSNGLVEMAKDIDDVIYFSTIGIQDGLFSDIRVKDYQRYRILGEPLPAGGCEKALVSVSINGKSMNTGYTVNPYIPWITFDNALTASDSVRCYVHSGWKKVYDFNIDKRTGGKPQVSLSTNTVEYNIYRKTFAAGTVILGGNFAYGAANDSIKQYGVFVAPTSGQTAPCITTISSPTTAIYDSATETENSLYAKLTATSCSVTANEVTIGFAADHGFEAGNTIIVAGTWTGITGTINGTWTISSLPTTSSIKYTVTSASGTASAFGTVELSGKDNIILMPRELDGIEQIQLKATDRTSIEDVYLDFTLSKAAIVYVAFDGRASSIPEWLTEFEKMPYITRVSDMEVFEDASGSEKLMVATNGSNGCVYEILTDETACDISATITVDALPPVGCATIKGKSNNNNTLNLELWAEDTISGVSAFQVSSREDMTTDGTTEADWIPFTTAEGTPFSYNYQLPPSAVASTGTVGTIPDDDDSGASVPPPTTMVLNVIHVHNGTILVGTDNPGRVYTYNQSTGTMTLLFETNEDSVLCMETYNKILYIGTGNAGKVFSWDGTTLTQIPTIPTSATKAVSMGIYNGNLYIGYYPIGEIWTISATGAMAKFKETSQTSVTGFAVYKDDLYWATENETIANGDTLVTTIKRNHKHFIGGTLTPNAASGASTTITLDFASAHGLSIGSSIVVAGTWTGITGTVNGTFTVATVPTTTRITYTTTAVSGTASVFGTVKPNIGTMLNALDGYTTTADSHVHQIINGVLQESDGHIHGLNGVEYGRVYRYNAGTSLTTIVHQDSDWSIKSIGTSTTSLFCGSSPNGKVLRFVDGEDIFIKSFQTATNTIRKIRYLNNKIYIIADQTIFAYDGTKWDYIAATTDNIADIYNGIDNGLLLLNDVNIESTSAAPNVVDPKLQAFVRFKDVAGNISELRDADTGDLIACYSPYITINTDGTTDDSGSGTTGGLVVGTNRIVEVDEDGAIQHYLTGKEPFYSANKVEEEKAVYYSEIFNGTHSLVQWTSISWTGTTPTGTSIALAVRVASTSDGIADAEFGDDFTDGTIANDLTNLDGQYLQFKATLIAGAGATNSPILSSVDIQLRTSQAVHFFTTNFSLPDKLMKGLLAYNGCCNPPITDIVFGVSGKNSVDWSDYYVISPNKEFELPTEHQTTNLRVGIKLISNQTSVPTVDEFAMLFSLANSALIRINKTGQPTEQTGQLVPEVGTRTVVTQKVQNHTHSITFNSSIVDPTNINGTTSINGGHLHNIINGIVQMSAGHSHTFTI